jgi:amidase
MASGAYTMPFSLTGHPVVVIPIGQTPDELPIGMQIVGKRWREMELLALSERECVRLWRLALP